MFGVHKAFFIVFEMGIRIKSLSASCAAVRIGVTEKTARLFMHKIRGAMTNSGGHPMGGKMFFYKVSFNQLKNSRCQTSAF